MQTRTATNQAIIDVTKDNLLHNSSVTTDAHATYPHLNNMLKTS